MSTPCPLVSIVVLSFNRLTDLQETVEYCRHYSYPNLELIVVDNGSTDGSAEYVAGLEALFQKVLLKTNTGSAEGHSVGMRQARGKYVITIDDDAFVEDPAIFGMVELFEQYPQLAAISFNCINYSQEYQPGQVKTTARQYPFEQVNASFDFFTESSAGFRKEALAAVGYHQSEFFYGGEDTELSMRLLAHDYRILNTPNLISYHKITNTYRDGRRLTKNSIRNILWMIIQYTPREQLLKHLVRYHWYLALAVVQKKDRLYLEAWKEAMLLCLPMLRRRCPLDNQIYQRVNFPYRMAFLW